MCYVCTGAVSIIIRDYLNGVLGCAEIRSSGAWMGSPYISWSIFDFENFVCWFMNISGWKLEQFRIYVSTQDVCIIIHQQSSESIHKENYTKYKNVCWYGYIFNFHRVHYYFNTILIYKAKYWRIMLGGHYVCQCKITHSINKCWI